MSVQTCTTWLSIAKPDFWGSIDSTWLAAIRISFNCNSSLPSLGTSSTRFRTSRPRPKRCPCTIFGLLYSRISNRKPASQWIIYCCSCGCNVVGVWIDVVRRRDIWNKSAVVRLLFVIAAEYNSLCRYIV